MKFKLTVLILLTFMISLSAETIKVKKVKGDARLFSPKSNAWIKLPANSSLTYDHEIKVSKNSKVILATDEGETVIPGPYEGALGKILTDDAKYSDNSVRNILNNIPRAKQGDKKIEITVQSAAVVKGSKAEIKKVPFRWRVSSEDKKEEAKENK